MEHHDHEQRNYIFPMIRSANQDLVTAVVEPGARAGAWLRVVPNPVTTTAQLTFGWPNQDAVDIELLDARGRLARTLSRGLSASNRIQRFTWEPEHTAARGLPAGLYFLRIRGRAGQVVERMILAR